MVVSGSDVYYYQSMRKTYILIQFDVHQVCGCRSTQCVLAQASCKRRIKSLTVLKSIFWSRGISTCDTHLRDLGTVH